MKSLFNKLLILIVAPMLIVACSEDDEIVSSLNPNASVDVSLSVSNIVLEQINASMDAITISWVQPDFGYDAAPDYKILIDNAGGDFSGAQTIAAGINLEMTLTTQNLNGFLLNLGFKQDEPADVEIRVLAVLGSYNSIISTSEVLTATAYQDKLDLSTTWGVVGSGANDWGATPDLPFYTTSVAGELVAYVNLIDGEIKFRKNNEWTLNYGDDNFDGTLEEGGANIPVTAGSYRINLNLNDLTYTMELYSWGIVGSAYNDWGATPDAELTYDPYSDQWRTIVTLLDGEMKIRKNSAWNTNYGDDGDDGVLDLGGANIVVTAGKYIVTVNFNDLSYSLEPIENIWGIVGSATPNGWGNGPDTEFTRDWSTNDDIWVLNNITLIDGEFKIRANNAWAINYGDDGNDGTLELDGTNIPATAGTYSLTLNFIDSDNPTYTIE